MMTGLAKRLDHAKSKRPANKEGENDGNVKGHYYAEWVKIMRNGCYRTKRGRKILLLNGEHIDFTRKIPPG